MLTGFYEKKNRWWNLQHINMLAKDAILDNLGCRQHLGYSDAELE